MMGLLHPKGGLKIWSKIEGYFLGHLVWALMSPETPSILFMVTIRGFEALTGFFSVPWGKIDLFSKTSVYHTLFIWEEKTDAECIVLNTWETLLPLRGVGPLSGGYGVPTFESRTQSIPPTTQNAGRHFSNRETAHSGQGCGVRKKNHDSHFLIPRDTQTRSHI